VATAAAVLALTGCEHGNAAASAPVEAGSSRERAADEAAAAGEQSARPQPTAAPRSSRDGSPQELRVRVLATYPHDATAYTQGLLWEPAGLVESAGRYGASVVRRYRPGEERPLGEERLGERFFAEGIAAVGDTLIQLTWQEGVAFYRDRATLREKKRRSYEGEGWGLCYDGERLIMSDGTDLLTWRDPESFLELRRVAVVAADAPLGGLNELECVDGLVFANVYRTDSIARIEPTSGRVTAMIDASGLLTPDELRAGAEVLNGIAYNRDRGTFYLTGKLWPRLFEVTFEPAAKRPGETH
jgi:glutaminyl-peptide cyclotransferase